jgi:hypothetical protein
MKKLILSCIVLTVFGTIIACGQTLPSSTSATPLPSITVTPSPSIPIGITVETDERASDYLNYFYVYFNNLKSDVPEEWLAPDQAMPRYKVLITFDQTDLDTCEFIANAFTVNSSSYTAYYESVDVQVELIDLIDGEMLIDNTFYGTEGKFQCPEQITVPSGEKSGTQIFYPDRAIINQWLLAISPLFTYDPDNIAGETPQQIYNVGDVIPVGKINITVNEVLYPTGDQFNKPNAGFKFLVVVVTVEDTSASLISIDPRLQMSVKDSSGQEYVVDDKIPVESGDLYMGGILAPGEKIRLQIGFQVPENATGLVFVFNGFFWDAGKVFVALP